MSATSTTPKPISKSEWDTMVNNVFTSLTKPTNYGKDAVSDAKWNTEQISKIEKKLKADGWSIMAGVVAASWFRDFDKVTKNMVPSDTLKQLIADNVEYFLSFGKKNSHVLRAKLYKLMDKESLTSDQKFLVYFFFAQIKNKDRVLEGINGLPTAMQSNADITKVKAFINKVIVQYTDDEKINTFAAVHLPTTHPSLDILCRLLVVDIPERSYELLLEMQTFSQINLSKEVQADAKASQKHFWDNVVTKTNRTDKKPHADKSGFQEEFYANSAADKYPLMKADMSFFLPKDNTVGYTKDEIEEYILNHVSYLGSIAAAP